MPGSPLHSSQLILHESAGERCRAGCGQSPRWSFYIFRIQSPVIQRALARRQHDCKGMAPIARDMPMEHAMRQARQEPASPSWPTASRLSSVIRSVAVPIAREWQRPLSRYIMTEWERDGCVNSLARP
jgi:hypothetical protein